MEQLPITEFDLMTLPSNIQLFKALIPFLEYNLQGSLALILRAYEYSYTAGFYKNPDNLRVAACSTKPHINLSSSINELLNNDEILTAIKPYCPENLKQILDNMSNGFSWTDFM